MAEEIKNIRLSKAAKEFNIGITTVVEYLLKKGHKIDNNPNTKISDTMYALLLKEFQSEKNVKEVAKKIGLEYTNRQTLSIENLEKDKFEDEEDDLPEFNIKNMAFASDIKKPDHKPIVKEVQIHEPEQIPSAPVLEVSSEEVKPAEIKEVEESLTEHKEYEVKDKEIIVIPVEEDIIPSVEVIIEEEPIVEEQVIENRKANVIIESESIGMEIEPVEIIEPEVFVSKEVEKEIQEEIIESENEVVSEEESISEPVNVNEITDGDSENKIKVIGMVDLSKINLKTKPDKKSKAEKEKEKETKKAEIKSKQKDFHKKENDVIKPKHHDKISKEQPITEINKEEITESNLVESAENILPTNQKQVNFIKTKYEKLEGPRILNKIDLSVFDKTEVKKQQPVASSSDKKTDKKRPRIKEKNKIIENINAQNKKHQDLKKPVNKEDLKVKKKTEFKIKKAVVDDNAIEKQIKETLARLSPLGKSKTSKYRREKRSQVSEKTHQEEQKNQEDKKIIKVTEFVTANELASMMDVPVTSVISTCMSLGMFVSINQRLDAEALSIVADEFGCKIEFVSVEVLDAISDKEDVDTEEDLLPRAPIVAVMGHVDHGKTSLLDYIRHANVIAGEAGGITQHIGAYEVKLESGKRITFLDTPGHEAFTAMRARGAKITDVVIIVVACDDKIMPQTIEAINHAQAAGVPIVFAINKIDKDNANPEKIKEELAQMNILVEDWGGKYQSQEISAKKGINVDLLLEKVLLEAELLDLKSNPNKKASGTVIESALDKGRGYVAKILVQNGTINVGDFVLAGSTYGKVKAMYNERNAAVKTAGPSVPVLLLGLNGAPQAGDKFNILADEREAKEIANKRMQLQREQGIRTQKHITLDEIGRRIAIGDFKQLNIIVKGDVDGSVEALSDSLLKLSTGEVQVQVIHKSVGQITESDVLLASASEAIIIGFQVRPSVNARKLAEQEQIDIRLYSIIYTAINEIKAAIEGMLSPDIVEKIICNIEIREVFKITKVGTIAGCMVLDGKITRNTRIRIIRDGIVVYTGRLGSLKRFKDDVKEVATGFECGLNIENFNDIKVGDIVEGYEETEVKRKL
jgi:translation initiation factor IF-2